MQHQIRALFVLGLVGGLLHAAPEVTTAPPRATTPAPDLALAAAPGVVSILRAGRPLALGTILNGDGRILTALSPLTHGNDLSARYHDGSTSTLRLEHFNRAWDIALMTPLQKNTKHGLKAAQRPFADEAPAFSRATRQGGRFALARVVLEPVEAWVGHDAAVLNQGLRLTPKPPDAELGGPIMNSAGEVVALVARACVPRQTPCQLASYGVPVAAVRAFLAGVPRKATLPSPWLGISVADVHSELVRGVRVVALEPGGPGELAGLRGETPNQAADIVVSVDGTPVPSRRSFLEEISRHEIGVPLTLLVLRQGKLSSLRLTPAPAPRPPALSGGSGRQEGPSQQNPRAH